MEVNMIGESLKFMVLGMSVVFIFLIIMVQAIKLQAYLIGKFFPDKKPASPNAPSVSTDDESARVAAVIAAVTEFRKQ